MIDKAKAFLLSAYHSLVRQLTPADIDQRRETFLAKYSIDHLVKLAGSDLLETVHGNGSCSGMFYDLEFADTYTTFGRIGGGSSLKFKVYAAGDGSGYKKKGQGNVPVPCSDAEAARMTAEIVSMLHKALLAAEEYHLSVGDSRLWHEFERAITSELPPSLEQGGHNSAIPLLGWAHKYLALCRPDIFSFHHQTRQLANHLVRLGEVPNDSQSRYLLDWQWRQVRTTNPELQECHPVLLMRAAYDSFGNYTNYWRVGTDEHTEQGLVDRWPAMQRGGFASIGWECLGNLRELLAGLEGKDARERIKEVFSAQENYDRKTPQTIGKWASQIHEFYAMMSPGDRIVAMKGQQVLGVGEIRGEYEYEPHDLQPHHREVRWHEVLPESWANAPGIRTAIYNITEQFPFAARTEILLLNSEPEAVSSPSHNLDGEQPEQLPLVIVPLTQLEQRIKDILERKGQLILYGPPGTGKTYHARQTARELITREICGGRAWAMINEEERSAVDDSIEFITFHPAYAYEDFIEGYRPTTAENGATSFELRDGVFLEICDRARQEPTRHLILLIDEINRGNVAAIMGELITLLESDKRDDICAVLPLSRRPFRVPHNVWIIGTMNTADRSISLLDAALRRRFGFVELLPEPDRIAVGIDDLSLSALLTEINARIRKHVTRNARELQVGHAYLMRAGQPLHTKEELLTAFRDDILPLLAEYCFENYATLAKILGDEIIDVTQQTPNASVLSNAHSLHKALRRLVAADPARLTELEDHEESAEAEGGVNDESEDVDLNTEDEMNGNE
jgi:5-methylcytosine-specific restriction enzyme B